MFVRPGILRFPVFVAGLLCASVAVSAENPKEGTISGTIVLENGSPADIKGFMYVSSESGNHGYFGAAGRFEDQYSVNVRPGTVWLSHYTEDYAPAWIGPIDLEAGETVKDVKIVLKQGFTQRLKITDVDGKPIPGVKIVSHPVINGSTNGPNFVKESDENGEYLYEHLAETKYVFRLEAPGFQPLTSDQIELEPDAVLQVNMLRTHPCTGFILNADGTPAPNAKLRARIELSKDGRGGGSHFGSGKGFWGETLATTDKHGRFELNQLRDGSHYLFVVETADSARAVIHDLQAGKEDVRITVPKRRDLIVTVTGDLGDLPQRSGKPFVAMRQRVRFQPVPDYNYGDLIGEDAFLEKTKDGGTATIRGVAIDLNPDAEEQEVEVSLGYGSKHEKTVKINPDGVTRVRFDLAND